MCRQGKNQYIIYIIATIFSLGIFSCSAFAVDSAVDTINVSVPESCTLTTLAGAGGSYNIEVANGQYKDDIGKTRLSVFCNTNDSFAIYAVGYSNDTIGTTDMISSSSSSLNIPTGELNQGNTSQWAMKIEAITGTGTNGNYTPTIQSPFNNFSSVPSTYAKIAEVASVTGSTVEGAIDATYAIYISPNQQAGNYTGKVRYTVVHPASEVPKQPIVTTAGNIGYVPNAEGVTDTMGDQPASANANVELWASNFQRPGYGFAGWTDKFDWVLNENDENGNGTGSNAGYHIYGPNQTITTPSDLATKGLTLYAVWVPSAGNIQDWTCPDNTTMPIGNVTALTDTRDNNVYTVAKLKDGNCWMTENLRLGGNSAMTLTTTDTVTAFTLPASTNSFTTSSYTTIQMNASNTLSGSTISNMTGTNNNIYSYGNYYSWAAAIGSTTAYSTNNQSVTTSICPKGWSLPKGGDSSNATNSEFWKLGTSVMGFAPSNNSDYQNTETNTEGKTASSAFRSFPNNFIYSGYISGSSLRDRGVYGTYWSSTVYVGASSYNLNLHRNYVHPGTYKYGKSYGWSVRCLAGS